MVNALHISDFTQTAQELQRTDINLFKNTKVPKGSFVSLRKFDVSFIDFQTFYMVLRENE